MLGILVLTTLTTLGSEPAADTTRTRSDAPPESIARTARVDLSLEQALERATAENDDVRIARAQARQARAQVTSARSAALPQVGGTLGYNRNVRSATAFSLPEELVSEMGDAFSGLPFGQQNSWSAGISVNQTVYAGGQVRAGMDIANQVVSAADLQVREAEAAIALQVTEAYYGAALAAEMVKIAEASLQQAEAHLGHVQLQRRSGNAADLDVTRAEVERENLVPRAIEARNAVDLAEADLKRLLNLPAGADLTLTTSLQLPPGAAQTVMLPSLEEAAAELGQRAAVQAVQAQVAIANGQVTIAQSQYKPTVSVNANLSQQAFPGDVLPGRDDWRSDVSVGFQVRVPLFDGFRRQGEVASARSQVEQAQLHLHQVQEGIRLEYDRAVRELDRAHAQIAARERTAQQAEEVHRLTALRFQQGLATQLEVNDARFQLQQARANGVQAHHDYRVALARAERALGRTLGRAAASH